MVRKLLTFGLIALLLAATTQAMAEEVYVTTNGHKYHTEDCRLIKNKKSTKIDKDDAEKSGFEPCKVCHKSKTAKEKSSEK